MSEYMNRVLKLKQKYANDMEQIAIEMKAENEVLEKALAIALKYYSVNEFNNVFHKGWNVSQCKEIEKQLSAYCLARAIKIRKYQAKDERFCDIKSYPITVWNDFMKRLKYEQFHR